MRFFRFIFGRFSIVFLLAAAQVLSFVALIMFIQQILPYYFFINIAFTVLALLIVLRLINRGLNPDYIVPWIIVVLIMPVAGTAIYLMLSQNRLSHRQKRLYQRIYNNIMPFAKQDEAVKEQLKLLDKHMYGQSEFLSLSNGLPIYNNTQTEYLSSGEQFFESLKQEIAKAERFVFLEFFIIETGLMFDSILQLLVQKIENGVEVRLMYDDIGSIATVGMNFHKKMRKLGIKCVKFSRFLPFASAVHNNRDHRKIVVIDGKVGFVTGLNLADEYINAKPLRGHWKDSALVLRGSAVKNLTALFLTGFNAQLKKCEDPSTYFAPCNELPDFLAGKKDKGKAELGFAQPFGDGPKPLYHEKISQNVILNLVNNAREYVYISTPYLIIDFQMTQALKQAAKRGIDVRIVTPKVPDKKLIFLMTRSAYPQLIKAGVKIFEYSPGFIHSKNILADSAVAVSGTINLDYRSLVHHFECGVWMFNTPAVAQIAEDFENIFSLSEQIAYEKSKLKLWQRPIKGVLQLFAPLL